MKGGNTSDWAHQMAFRVTARELPTALAVQLSYPIQPLWRVRVHKVLRPLERNYVVFLKTQPSVAPNYPVRGIDQLTKSLRLDFQ